MNVNPVQMFMNNTPVGKMIQAVQGGMNPMNFLQNISNTTPQAQQVLSIMQGKTPEQLRETVENMAKQRGTNIQSIAQSLGLPIK